MTETAQPVTFGIVGCGAISTQHLEAIAALDEARLGGVASASLDRARAAGERWGVPWTTDVEELLGREDIDAISVLTPSGLHPGQAMAALRRGRHVLVEKPIALSVPDAEAVIAEARARDLTLGTVSQRRFEGPIGALHDAVAAGALGTIALILTEGIYHRPQSYYDSAAWRGTVALDGGVLMNQAIHMIDLVRWLGGPVASVAGHVATRTHRMEAEDVATVSVRFADGALGEIVATTSAAGESPSELRVIGDRGQVRISGGEVVVWDVPDRPRPAADAAADHVPVASGAPPPARDRADGADRVQRDLGDDRERLHPSVPGLHRGRPRAPSAVRDRRGWARCGRGHRGRLRVQPHGPDRRAGASAGMKVGAAVVDITPPLGHPMDGFGARVGGATGVHDPLHARALVAEGRDGTAVALVVADLLQIDPRLQAAIAADVRRTTGIPRERLQLAGTHTHSGPAFPEPSDVEAEVGRRIASAVDEAWRGRREATAAIGVGRVDGIAANRRPNGGPVDDRVTVARFDDDAGGPLATLVNYGCHATTLGPDNTLYTADFPGVACAAVQDAVGGIAMFTTGLAGRREPRRLFARGQHGRHRRAVAHVRIAERYGQAIGAVAAAVHETLQPAPSERVWGTRGSSSSIGSPCRLPPPRAPPPTRRQRRRPS